MSTKTIGTVQTDTGTFEGWLIFWLIASAVAGFVAGGNLFPESTSYLYHDETSFGVPAAFGMAFAVLVANIPVVVIAHVLLAIFREQVAIKYYVRATAEMQAEAQGEK